MSIDQIIDFLKLISVIFVLVFIIFIVLYLSGGNYIRENWTKFRCNPLIIPIAGMFGKNTKKNAQQCFFKTFKYFFDFLMRPFQYIIKIIQKILKGLFGDIDAFRTLLKPIRLFILNATQKFYDTIDKFMTSIFYSFGKTRNILGRMGSVFKLTLYTLEAVQFSIKSVWDGPIGQVARKWPPKLGKVKKFFCLHINSKILNQKCEYVLLRKIPLGNLIWNKKDKPNKLLGLVTIEVDNCPLYNWYGTLCSGNHLVYHLDKWTKVKKIIKHVQLYSGKLICPITSQNIFWTKPDIKLRDYEECPSIDHLILSRNLTLLNEEITYLPNIPYNTIGISDDTSISSGNTSKLIKDFKIGDYFHKEKIIGIYKYLNHDKYIFIKNGLVLGGRQVVFSQEDNKWLPIYLHHKVEKIEKLSKNIIFNLFITKQRYIIINHLKLASVLDAVNIKTAKENDNFTRKILQYI